MKKKIGYTLAEVLITLTIVGAVAAMTGPIMSKLTPDVTKIKFLQTYDMLKEVILEIVNNEEYYPYEYSHVDYSEFPLANIRTLEDGVERKNKIATIMAYHMGLDIEYPPEEQYSEDYSSEEKTNFTAKNGVSFVVRTDVRRTTNTIGRYKTDIYIDIDGPNKGLNCLYNVDNPRACSKPDVFKVCLTASGHMIPADVLGAKYIQTRLDYKKEKYSHDRDWISPENNLDLFKFELKPVL